MFQCMGLGTVETGGCGEDWWHPECLVGLPRGLHTRKTSSLNQIEKEVIMEDEAEEKLGQSDEEVPLPQGFPHEDYFDALICYKCVESNPWIKRYAGTTGFLPPVYNKSVSSSGDAKSKRTALDIDTHELHAEATKGSKKRKALEDEFACQSIGSPKRFKEDLENTIDNPQIAIESLKSTVPQLKHDTLPISPSGTFSLFLKEDFREHLCHCPKCYPNLIPHPQLVEEEETYESPLDSEDGGNSEAPAECGAPSQGTGSLLDRGEAALSTMDRVKAIEGVMVYNHLKDKVKDFLKPYAESGKPVGAEDIKAYFEKLRGDDLAIKEAGSRPAL